MHHFFFFSCLGLVISTRGNIYAMPAHSAARYRNNKLLQMLKRNTPHSVTAANANSNVINCFMVVIRLLSLCSQIVWLLPCHNVGTQDIFCRRRRGKSHLPLCSFACCKWGTVCPALSQSLRLCASLVCNASWCRVFWVLLSNIAVMGCVTLRTCIYTTLGFALIVGVFTGQIWGLSV